MKVKLNLINRTKELPVYSRRWISIPLVGSNNDILIKNSFKRFKHVVEFENYVCQVFSAFSKYYVLTNKSKLEGSVLCILSTSVLLLSSISTRFYQYIQSNNLAVNFPVGFSKLIDYVCIPTNKIDSVDLSSTQSKVVSCFELETFIEFLNENYFCEVTIVNEDGSETTSYSPDSISNIKSLCRLLGEMGYSMNYIQLHQIVGALRSKLNDCRNHESALFDFTIDTFESIAYFVKDIHFAEYGPARSNTNQLRLAVFRNSESHDSYLVMPSAFRSLELPSQQILFCFLHIFRPDFSINGIQGHFPLAEDAYLDLSKYKLSAILSSLLSFEAVVPSRGSTVAEVPKVQKREFSTLSSVEYSSLLRTSTRFIKVSVIGETTICYPTKPLVITFNDSS